MWKSPVNLEEIQEGVVLRDPDCGPFTTTAIASLQYELQFDAVNEAFSHMANYKPKMPLWDRPVSEDRLVFFVLFDASASELARMQSEIQKAITASVYQAMERCVLEKRNTPAYMTRANENDPPITVELVPWERHRSSTRRDLATFWNEYLLWDYTRNKDEGLFPFLYLTGPFKSIDETLFGIIRRLSDELMLAIVTTGKLRLGSICRAMHWGDHNEWNELHYLNTPDSYPGWIYKEQLEDYDQPLYRNYPDWEVAIYDRYTIPLFSISNHHNDQDTILGLQSEMGVQNAGPGAHSDGKVWTTDNAIPFCYFMPWKGGESGRVEDIWNIIKEIAMHPTSLRTCDIEIVCLDQRSAVDSTVILAAPSLSALDPEPKLLGHLPIPHVRGFKFVRVPANQVWELMQKRFGLMNFERKNLKWTHCRRPGWPGPKELPDEYEEGEVFVDGDSLP